MSSNYDALFIAHQNACEEYDKRAGDMSEALHMLDLHRKEGGRDEIKRAEANRDKVQLKLEEADRKEKIAKKNLDASAK